MRQLQAQNFYFNQAYQKLVLTVQRAYYSLVAARAGAQNPRKRI